jgi:hypothetical protein
LAPTNDAFDKIDASNLEEILANATELNRILRRHIIVAKVESIDVEGGPVNTIGGEVRMSSRPIICFYDRKKTQIRFHFIKNWSSFI